MLSLQHEVARAIAEQVEVAGTPQEHARLSDQRRVLPEVYQSYLKGRFHWSKRTEEGMKTAMGHFQSALAIDPSYAPAYAGLADCYTMLTFWGAMSQYRKTIELDPQWAAGHQYLGQPLVQLRRYDEAITELQTAVRLSQGSAEALAFLGYAYGAAGRRAEAVQVVRRLTEQTRATYIDPYYAALVYVEFGGTREALDWLTKAIDDRSYAMAVMKVEPMLDPLRADRRFQDLLRRMRLQ